MENDLKPLDDLHRIRNLMEKSTMYHSLSGLSGVVAGIVGIVIYFITYLIANPYLDSHMGSMSSADRRYVTGIFLIAATVALVLAFTGIFFFNYQKAKREGAAFLESSMKKMFINLFIPLVAGGIYCLMLLGQQQYLLIAPTMLVFYGLAMIQASRHTIVEIQHLGMAELLIGLVAIFIPQYGLWLWLLGFGFVNLFYGAYIYFRYEK
jgi:hypothetical protein